jgi:hypothetical protein
MDGNKTTLDFVVSRDSNEINETHQNEFTDMNKWK